MKGFGIPVLRGIGIVCLILLSTSLSVGVVTGIGWLINAGAVATVVVVLALAAERASASRAQTQAGLLGILDAALQSGGFDPCRRIDGSHSFTKSTGKEPQMSDSPQVGRFYFLPGAGEFELHLEGGEVLAGRIGADLIVEELQQFNGTGVLCSCIVRGQPPILLSIGEVR